MSNAIVQTATLTREDGADANDPVQFPSQPTEGNVLLVWAVQRYDETGVTIVEEGWERFFVATGETASAQNRRVGGLWYKVAGEDESQTVTVEWLRDDVPDAIVLVEVERAHFHIASWTAFRGTTSEDAPSLPDAQEDGTAHLIFWGARDDPRPVTVDGYTVEADDGDEVAVAVAWGLRDEGEAATPEVTQDNSSDGALLASVILGDAEWSPTVSDSPEDTAYYDGVIADDPVALWPLWTDGEAAEGDHDMTLSGADHNSNLARVPWHRYAQFDGVDDYAYADSAQVRLAGPLTYECWMWVDSWSDQGSQIMGLNDRVGIRRARSTNDLAFSIRDDNNSELGNSSRDWGSLNAEFSFGQWVHVVAVYDRDNDALRFYINGEEEDSNSTDGQAATTAPTAEFTLGAQIGSPTGGTSDTQRYAEASIAWVAVYDHALSAQRIQAHYDAAFEEPGEPDPEPSYDFAASGFASQVLASGLFMPRTFHEGSAETTSISTFGSFAPRVWFSEDGLVVDIGVSGSFTSELNVLNFSGVVSVTDVIAAGTFQPRMGFASSGSVVLIQTSGSVYTDLEIVRLVRVTLGAPETQFIIHTAEDMAQIATSPGESFGTAEIAPGVAVSPAVIESAEDYSPVAIDPLEVSPPASVGDIQ